MERLSPLKRLSAQPVVWRERPSRLVRRRAPSRRSRAASILASWVRLAGSRREVVSPVILRLARRVPMARPRCLPECRRTLPARPPRPLVRRQALLAYPQRLPDSRGRQERVRHPTPPTRRHLADGNTLRGRPRRRTGRGLKQHRERQERPRTERRSRVCLRTARRRTINQERPRRDYLRMARFRKGCPRTVRRPISRACPRMACLPVSSILALSGRLHPISSQQAPGRRCIMAGLLWLRRLPLPTKLAGLASGSLAGC